MRDEKGGNTPKLLRHASLSIYNIVFVYSPKFRLPLSFYTFFHNAPRHHIMPILLQSIRFLKNAQRTTHKVQTPRHIRLHRLPLKSTRRDAASIVQGVFDGR